MTETATGVLRDVVDGFFAVTDTAILWYFLVINSCNLLITLLGSRDVIRTLRRAPVAGHDDAAASRFTPPISVIVPAYNEEAVITEAMRAMLLLRYPRFEIVVVDDGSTDGTLERLREAFDLVEVEHVVPREIPSRGDVESVHLPRTSSLPLVVVRKQNGGRADALNVGIDLARYPLVCMVDADSLLGPEALLSAVKPLMDDPTRTVGCGGVVGIANGCVVRAGRVVEVRMPRESVVRIQTIEYLRAFLLGRTAWSRLGGLLIISGAFGVFRREAVVEVGGLDPDCMGEDAELVLKLHRSMRDRRRDYRIVFVSEPICWTEAPPTARILARQRRRWHRGLTELLLKHRRMIANPRYGRIGLLTLPYYVVFELLAPLIEVAGLVLVPLGVALGAVNVAFLWHFLLLAYGLAMVVSLVAVAAEEFAFHRFTRWRDTADLMVASLIENLGYRQFLAVAQLRGMWDALHGSQQDWGVMTRKGFAPAGSKQGGER
ncbi:glycosyltransferase family 2 protein [Streptomyces meridianus]|uniref:Glycosyltransferase family 2 protein n=1 Tax=Streptomyces meridianus TaxID=2938945 RepID=A0ABT0XDV2_9ACTN|nr:glycosyltransferase family 2 protein [Streptomyces meridianus]MCM2580500.1 glycosyltransferase family 2 protein [Streptomyces meridianus]